MNQVMITKLCNIEIGKTPSRSEATFWGTGVNWVSIRDMKEKYIFDTNEEITTKAISKTGIKLVPKNTVIMSFKLSVGKVAITGKDMYTNEAVAAFHVIDDNKLHNEYLYYALQTLRLSENTDRSVMGLTLNKQKLKQLSIPLPSLEIQKKIVEVLDKAQALIDVRKEQNRLMDELSKSVFYEMFSDYEKYPQKSIASVCSAIYDCPHSTPRYSDSKTSFRCLRTSNLGNGYIDWDNLAYVDENTYNERNKRYIPNVGDVVYSREGAILGIAALVNEVKPMCLGQRLMIFTLDNKLVNSIFFWMILNSQMIRRQVELNIGGAAAPRINIKDIKKFEIFLPPIDIQNEFAEKISKIEEIKQELSVSLYEINNTYNALLQKAFKGDLFGGE